MGTSPYLKLRFPELNDPANVPTDMRELTDDIESVYGGLLPQPVFRQNLTNQNVTSTTNQLFTPVATITNPHSVLYLLVRISIGIWAGTAGNVFYSSIKASGYTALADWGQLRLTDYESGTDDGIATVAPGATLSVQLQGHRNNTSTTMGVASVRNVLTPVGWLKTGVIS